MKTLCIKRVYLMTTLLFALSFSSHAQMDLHTHLDMKPGMGPLLKGNFLSPTKSHHWNSRWSTKASSESLASLQNPSIVVVSLYAHPILSVFAQKGDLDFRDLPGIDDQGNLRRALDIEYFNLKKWIQAHSSRYVIVRNASEAGAALKNKKIAIVLSIEGGAGALETEEDFKKWIDERGVSIVTPFHLTEDHFGGVALMKGVIPLFNTPFDFIRSIWITAGHCLKTYCKSTVGIKGDGHILIQRLLDRKVWIDLAHANDIQAQELVLDFEKQHLPLLVTHTQLRNHFPAERGLGETEIEYLKKNDGIIGFIPTNDMMSDIPTTPEDCKSGLRHFRSILAEAAQALGVERVALGSDSNAPLKGLSPSCDEETSEIAKDGYYHFSQWPELVRYVAPSPDWSERSMRHFLELWKQIR